MSDRETCPKCGRPAYEGRSNRVPGDECALDDGIGCRAYRRGVEVGESRAAAKIRELEWLVEANEIALTQYETDAAEGIAARFEVLVKRGRDG